MIGKSASKVLVGVFAVISFSLAGCTSIKKSSVSKSSHVKGPLEKNYDVSKIELDLARRVIVVPGDDTDNEIIITAVLQTFPLIQAQEMELVKSKKATKEQAIKTIKSTAKQIVKDKTCFLVDIKSSRGGSRSESQHWRARLEAPAGQFQTVTFSNLRSMASDRDPMKDFVGLGHLSNLVTKYSLACAPRRVSLDQTVKLHLSAKWDVSKNWHTLVWRAPIAQ